MAIETSDGVTISVATGSATFPPGLDAGHQTVARNARWLLINGRWYRWENIYSRLDTALAIAPLNTVEHFLSARKNDLYLFLG